jgi:hypothetical protein
MASPAGRENGEARRSLRVPIEGVGGNGVSGVLGVEMYLPLHFGQRRGLSRDGVVREPFSFPARRGWYL